MNLFAYGTLMDAEIMTQASGAIYRYQKATLAQYVRKAVRGEVYPGIVQQDGGFVDGVVYFDLSPEAFDRLDDFEGLLYVRTEAVAICEDGARVGTYTYVIHANAAHQLSDDDWSYEKFLANDKKIFQCSYQGYDKLG